MTAHYMAKLSYAVFPKGAQWWLSCRNHHLGGFRTQAEAVAAGKRAVCQAMGSGFDVELLVTENDDSRELKNECRRDGSGSPLLTPEGDGAG